MKAFHHTCYAMGTRFNLVLPGVGHDTGEMLSRGVETILKTEEERMSRYLGSSEISYINSFAFEKSVKVSEEMAKIISYCSRFYRDTGGAFDPSSPSRKKKIDPETDRPENVNQEDGFGEVVFNSEENTLRFLTSNTWIDLGGFGKGWAIEKIVSYLCHNSISSAFISFGESSITALGNHPLGGPWKVGIPQPDWNLGALAVELTDESVSISGLKRKQSKGQARKEGHIVNSLTRTVVEDERMAMVKSGSALEAEVLSTALIASGPEQLTTILNTFVNSELYTGNQKKWEPLNRPIIQK